MPEHAERIRAGVRQHYADAAVAASAGRTACCGPGAGCGAAGGAAGTAVKVDDGTGTDVEHFGAGHYAPDDRAALPVTAVRASLGCGNPLLVADLRPGETVLDLGSGGGIDVLLSARRVGPTGRAYGLDMTDEMLAVARRNAAEAGAENVEFRKGTIEDIPLADGGVDVIISNCVINLSPDKPAVFGQMFRVLRSGGRVAVSDVVAEDRLTPAERAERGDWAGCVAGALSRSEYVSGLTAAGFADVEVEFTQPVADGLHNAVVRARRP